MSREMKYSGIPWIGDIPKEWKVSRLKHLATDKDSLIIDGDWIESNVIEASGIRYLTTGNVGDGVFKEQGQGYISQETFNALNCTMVYADDLVFSRLNYPMGRSCIIPEKYERCVVAVDNVIFRPNKDVSKRYLMYVSMCTGFQNENALIARGATMQRMSRSQLVRVFVPIPDKDAQQKIASFLDRKCSEIDEMIALQEKIVEELKAYKQSVITEAVTKGLNPDVPMKDSGIEWIGEIPEHWSIDKIIRSFGLIGSGTTPKSTDEDNFNGNIRWIQSGDINGGVMTECKNRISEKTLHTTSALKIYNPPFIIIAMYGASVGNTSISMIDGCVNQACCVLSESHLNLEYSFNVIKSCKDFWIRKAVGGGQPNISQDTIKSTWIPIPPKEEQEQIASYLNTKCTEIDNLISIKLSKIDSLKEYKKSIIYEYVTGKKEVIE